MDVDKDDISIATTLSSLKRRGFEARFAEDRKAAREMILGLIPQSATVASGGSATLQQLGIMEELARRGTVTSDTQSSKLWDGPPTADRMAALELLRRQSMTFDFFLSSTNVVTSDGRLVNVDGSGNRVAGMFFGPKRVIVVAGRNKIVPSLDVGLDRLRHIISPIHMAWITPNKKTPCVVTGKCNDCTSQERSCCVTTIIEGRPYYTHMTVIIVDEDLGLGWDPEWPEERIKIITEHYQAAITPVKITSRGQKAPE